MPTTTIQTKFCKSNFFVLFRPKTEKQTQKKKEFSIDFFGLITYIYSITFCRWSYKCGKVKSGDEEYGQPIEIKLWISNVLPSLLYVSFIMISSEQEKNLLWCGA